VIKILSGAIKHPVNRSQAEFHQYWQQRHGPLFANTPELRKYVQHHSLPEAYAGTPSPTLHGASMFWYDSIDVLRNPPPSPLLSEAIRPEQDTALYDWYVASSRYGSPDTMTLQETVRADDRQLFDRTTPDWPLDGKRTSIVAQERVIVDGPTTPTMVKVIWAFLRKPGLTLTEFQEHWHDVHGQLGARLPGMRRYVQNHSLPEAHAVRPVTHDGWSEAWWDNLESLHQSRTSPEWQALSADGQTLFSYPMAVIVARETIIKDTLTGDRSD